MPDIAMCEGRSDDGKRECPHRLRCYRHLATPTPTRQSYFVGMPLREDDTCQYLWSVEERGR